MIFLAKVGLGIVGTVVAAGAYTCRQGFVRVDVDESAADGSHVHVWAPAAMVPMAIHVVPQREMDKAVREAREYMPVARAVVHELGRLPDSVLVEVKDPDEHVVISTYHGAIKIDVRDRDEEVHVVCPLATIEDVTTEIANKSPGA
jgi:hypothetical protein